MMAGQTGTAGTYTCYSHCCFENEWAIHSSNASFFSVQNPGFAPRILNAHAPGSIVLSSQASGPINEYGDIGYFDSYRNVSIYDATPVINAIVPNTIPAGGSHVVEIWGLHFGTNPSVHASAGITVGTIQYASPTQINVPLTHNPGCPPGQYNVWVTSGLSKIAFRSMGDLVQGLQERVVDLDQYGRHSTMTIALFHLDEGEASESLGKAS
jgi:hypothetical protein